MKTTTSCLPTIAAIALSAACAGELRADTIDFTLHYNTLFQVHHSNFTNATMWADGNTPREGNDYRIVGASSSQQRYCGLGVVGTWTFPGDSLRIGQYGNLDFVNSGNCEFPRGGLCLDDGGKIWTANGWKTTPTLSGTVTVGDEATASIYGYQSTVSLTFNGDFIGDVGSKLIVRNEEPFYKDGNNKSCTNETFGVFFKGDMSRYKGTIEVGASSGKWASSYFNATHVDGSVLINATGTIAPCAEGSAFGEFSVSNLVLAAGATMKLGVNATTCGTVRVTHSLMLPESGKVTIDLSSTPDSVWHTQLKRPLLIAPLGTGLSAEKFEVSLPSGFYDRWSAAWASLVVEKTEGVEILMWEDHTTCKMVKNDSNNESAFLPKYASHWAGLTEGNALDPEMLYFVDKIDGGYGIQIRSPYETSGIAEFGGWGLVLSGQNYFYLYQNVKVDRLFVRPNTRIVSVNSTPTKTLQGTLTVVDYEGSTDYARFYAPDGKTFNIQSELRGKGSILLTTDADTSRFPGNGNAIYQLDGMNTLFEGRIRVSNATPATYVTTLRASDGRNLGGALPAFVYNGVELSAGSRLEATASFELTEVTRGLFVNGTGRISIPGAADELKLRSQLTMAGTLVKEGVGTLALGGTVKFTADQSDMPVAAMNILQVAEGRVRPASKAGADGLSISFASGTGLRLAPFAETDEDVLRYGLYSVKTGAPFDLTATGGKLNVALALPANADELPQEFSFSVCTVQSGAASALDGHIVLSRIKGYDTRFESVPNGDGTVTFKATCRRIGFVISFR